MAEPGWGKTDVHLHHAKRGSLITRQPLQLSYVTTDIEQAMAHYARELNATEFSVTDREMQATSAHADVTLQLRLAMGFVGDSMVELIQPLSGATDLYTRLLPEDKFGISFHHFGYVVDPAVEWDDFRANIDDGEIALEGRGDPSFVYLDTYQTLGHYLEYLHFSQERYLGWIERIPRND